MNEAKKYIAIELEMFRPDTLVGCKLYLHPGKSEQYILYKREGLLITYQDMERLIILYRGQWAYGVGRGKR